LWLRECWELWYWAMFLPSRLQERMNEWSPAEEHDGVRPDTTFRNILWDRINWRFLFQFIQVSCWFSLPLFTIILIHGQLWDWLLLPVTLLTTYSFGVLGFPISLNIPLIFNLAYFVKPNFFVDGLAKVIKVFPLAVTTCVVGVLIALWVFFVGGKRNG